MVKQAILGLVHLSSRREDLKSKTVLKILQVIRDSNRYRSNPRRFAVQSLGTITYYDKQFILPSMTLLEQLTKPTGENSQYVRKASFVALSRIGRKYPQLQDRIVPLFISNLKDEKLKTSVAWGVIIGLGRMAQSNVDIRNAFANEFLSLCSHKHMRMRWAGIKALGHACCPIDNIPFDERLSNLCFEYATVLLKYGTYNPSKGPVDTDEWKKEDVYLVQYAATQALSLLLRSQPVKWWDRIAPIFGDILLNPNYAAMIKATVMIAYGKITHFMTKDNPYYEGIKNLLFELSSNKNILVAEPATYGLCNFALAHSDLYVAVKHLIANKIGMPLRTADPRNLLYYIKTWCKIISKNHDPTTNHLSSTPFVSIPSDQNLVPVVTPSFTSANFGGEFDQEKKYDSVQPVGSVESTLLSNIFNNFSHSLETQVLPQFNHMTVMHQQPVQTPVDNYLNSPLILNPHNINMPIPNPHPQYPHQYPVHQEMIQPQLPPYPVDNKYSQPQYQNYSVKNKGVDQKRGSKRTTSYEGGISKKVKHDDRMLSSFIRQQERELGISIDKDYVFDKIEEMKSTHPPPEVFKYLLEMMDVVKDHTNFKSTYEVCSIHCTILITEYLFKDLLKNARSYWQNYGNTPSR